jgi:hypothetical protein
LGWVSALDLEGRTIWIVYAHRYGKRFIIRADEMLTAFLEVQSAIRDASGRTQSVICLANVGLSLLSNPVLAAQFAPQRTHCQQR